MCLRFSSLKLFQYKMLNIFALGLLLFLQCITNGASLKCFVCDSSDNPACADLRSNKSIVAEECTLEKMKSIETWLSELNKFAYYDTGANKSPLMNCQKVVARDPQSDKMITARFCQLNTGGSDACKILQEKLSAPAEEEEHYTQSGGSRYDARREPNNAGGGGGGVSAAEDADDDKKKEEQFHCSICSTDSCNGQASLFDSLRSASACSLIALMLFKSY